MMYCNPLQAAQRLLHNPSKCDQDMWGVVEGKEGVAVCVASGGNLLASESCFQADSDWSIDVDYGEATLLDSRDLRVVTAVFRSALVGHAV